MLFVLGVTPVVALAKLRPLDTIALVELVELVVLVTLVKLVVRGALVVLAGVTWGCLCVSTLVD